MILCVECADGNCRQCAGNAVCECEHPRGRWPESRRSRRRRVKSDPHMERSIRTVSGGLPELGKR